MKLHGIFFVLFNFICATISAAPLETGNAKVKPGIATVETGIAKVKPGTATVETGIAKVKPANATVETGNVKTPRAANDPALLCSHHDRVIATSGKAAFDENVPRARNKKRITNHTVSAINKSVLNRKETFAKYFQYLTTDIFHPQSILPEFYFARLSSHQLVFEDVLPEIIIPLNNDLRRLRVAANTKAIPAAPLQIVPLRPLVDATTFQTSASYHFSSTDFHHYLFRLKPF